MTYLPGLLAGAVVLKEPDLVLVDAGVPSDTFNVVCGAHLDPATADARFAAAIAHFQARDAPFAWWVGPTSRPPDLGARLIARGLAEAEAELGMALDLEQLPPAVPLPAGVMVGRVATPTDLAS